MASTRETPVRGSVPQLVTEAVTVSARSPSPGCGATTSGGAGAPPSLARLPMTPEEVAASYDDAEDDDDENLDHDPDMDDQDPDIDDED